MHNAGTEYARIVHGACAERGRNTKFLEEKNIQNIYEKYDEKDGILICCIRYLLSLTQFSVNPFIFCNTVHIVA